MLNKAIAGLLILMLLATFSVGTASAAGIGDLLNNLQDSISAKGTGSSASGNGFSGLLQGFMSFFQKAFASIGDIFKGIFGGGGSSTAGTSGGASGGNSGGTSGGSSGTDSSNDSKATPATPATPADAASPASGIAGKIVGEAKKQLGTTKYKTAATDNGNLACAAYVSGVLKDAGAIKGNGSLNTVGLRGILQSQGWKRVTLATMKPGDVILWGPYPGGKHGHVGIIEAKHGGTWYDCENSSSKRVPVNIPTNTKRPIVAILRHPSAS